MRLLGISILIPCLAAASLLSDHYANATAKEFVEAVMKSCAEEHGVTEDEITRIHDFSSELSNRREAKFDEGTDEAEHDTIELDLATSYKPEDMKKVLEISWSCYNSVPKQPDHCEYLFNIMECFTKATNAAKIKEVPFWDVPHLVNTSRYVEEI